MNGRVIAARRGFRGGRVWPLGSEVRPPLQDTPATLRSFRRLLAKAAGVDQRDVALDSFRVNLTGDQAQHAVITWQQIDRTTDVRTLGSCQLPADYLRALLRRATETEEA